MSSLVPTLSNAQFQTVYNVFSFALASMLFTAIFLLVSQGRVLPRYRQAIVVSAMVCGIAAYHYFRIFNSFNAAYLPTELGGPFALSAEGFNEAYRYVDWLLTVPLLLLETVAVLALPRATRTGLLTKLIPASVLMIALGYPGEIAVDTAPKMIWGALSTIPFLFILYVLFVELTKSLDRQPPEVAASVARLRLLLIATWGVYPISYLFPVFGLEGSDAFVARQVGYSVADVLAKCLYGLMIYKIARMKSTYDDPGFAAVEFDEAPSSEARKVSVAA
jgi:bacteriorhodopsin